MSPRHVAARPRRPAVAALVAATAGACLLASGITVLTRSPAVEAHDFTARASASSVSGAVRAPDGELATDGQIAVAATPAPAPAPPARVSLAAVTAEVVPVGVLPSGELQLPDDPARVGWWAAGALAGQAEGTVVLAGHMDGLRRTGAMSALLDLEAGDPVAVEDRRGTTRQYLVLSRSTVSRDGLDPGLFTSEGGHRLVLITCGGRFDEATGRYAENIVVIAEPVGR